ncbi:MAG TPA: type II toxin-antitoxin system RelE/ParE family toxin [Verrucomicrobiae bacterium]|nr:type II toxin-antitoxin system RelE/ParE family toxin [Verrucomicrobiae bacterium]
MPDARARFAGQAGKEIENDQPRRSAGERVKFPFLIRITIDGMFTNTLTCGDARNSILSQRKWGLPGGRISRQSRSEAGAKNRLGAAISRRIAARSEAVFQKLEGEDELWEVRAEFGGDAFRLLGFWDAGQLIILTNGFAKKSQKTPEREITLAAQRKRDYLNRKAKR